MNASLYALSIICRLPAFTFTGTAALPRSEAWAKTASRDGLSIGNCAISLVKNAEKNITAKDPKIALANTLEIRVMALFTPDAVPAK